ncbi:MAG: hypothetical protein V1909_03410, partial [Candidatus Micrarchaeota archaeon]
MLKRIPDDELGVRRHGHIDCFSGSIRPLTDPIFSITSRGYAGSVSSAGSGQASNKAFVIMTGITGREKCRQKDIYDLEELGKTKELALLAISNKTSSSMTSDIIRALGRLEAIEELKFVGIRSSEEGSKAVIAVLSELISQKDEASDALRKVQLVHELRFNRWVRLDEIIQTLAKDNSFEELAFAAIGAFPEVAKKILLELEKSKAIAEVKLVGENSPPTVAAFTVQLLER